MVDVLAALNGGDTKPAKGLSSKGLPGELRLSGRRLLPLVKSIVKTG